MNVDASYVWAIMFLFKILKALLAADVAYVHRAFHFSLVLGKLDMIHMFWIADQDKSSCHELALRR